MENIDNCFCNNFLKKEDNLKLYFSSETYNIFGNLNKGEKIILKYFGKLVTDEDMQEKKLFINYGYGNLWSDKNVIEMTLCSHSDKVCYCVQIELTNNENLFFCFMDNNNNWDLNDNCSYAIQIDEAITTLAKKEVAVSLADEEYISPMNKLLNKLTDKILNLFSRIGDLFEKKVKV